jgi:hypothetical protein
MHIFSFSKGSDVWGLWLIISLAGKVYICYLLTAVAYATVFHIRTLLRLYDLQKADAPDESGADRSRLASMWRGIENMRQLQLLLLLVFGIALANEVLATLRGIRYSSMSLSEASIEVFEPAATFAFVVFGILTFLHVSQWIVVARLRRVFPLWSA